MQIENLSQKIVACLVQRKEKLALAESCTGGLMAASLTAMPGCSAVFEYGIVAYANDIKTRTLDVSPKIFAEKGAVSSECAAAMAEGARKKAGADYAVSATGIAGPGGGTETKPVGLVYLGLAGKGGVETRELLLAGNRAAVREETVRQGFEWLLAVLETES